MTTTTETEPRAPESKQPSESGDPPEPKQQTAIQKITGMLPEFDPAYVGRLADRLKEELNVLPPAEPPTNCDRAPTLAECKRIKALYPKIDLNHENLWYNVCDDFDATIVKHGWECLLDVAEYAERWTSGDGGPAATLDTKTRRDVEAVIDGAERKRHGILGDLVQFIEDWTPEYQEKADDIRERVRRITGLVEAAHLCEGSITHGGGDKNEIENYFTAVSGSIFVAANKCRRLLADLNAEPINWEKPAAGGDGVSKTETTQESPLGKQTEQAGNLSGLICAARVLADGLELGAKGDELKLTEVLRAAETAANELFGESCGAA